MKITCSCGVQLNVPDDAIGKMMRCPKCNNTFTVTAPATPEITAVPPSPVVPSDPAAIRPAHDDFGRKERDEPLPAQGERHDDRRATGRDDDDRPRRSRRRDDDDGPRRSRYRDDEDGPRRSHYRDDEEDASRGPARTSGAAVASLIVGFVSFIVPIVASIVGVVLSIRGMNACSRSPRVTGKGLAIAGLVLSIVGFFFSGLLLLGLGVPWFQRLRESATRTEDTNKMKLLCLATQNAHDAWKILPPATGSYGQVGLASYSLSVHLMPYIEQMPLYQTYAVPGAPMPSTAYVPPFQSPLDYSTGDYIRVQNYAANLRVFTDTGFCTNYTTIINDGAGLTNTGAAGWGSGNLINRFPDGTTNTILYATRCANNLSVQSQGFNVNCSEYDALVCGNSGAFFGANPMFNYASANSTGGFQLNPSLTQTNCQAGAVAHAFGNSGITAGMADGSVHHVSTLVSPLTWNCAVQPNDLVPMGTDW